MAGKGIDFVVSLNATKFNTALNGLSSKTRAASSAIGRYWSVTSSGAGRAASAISTVASSMLSLKSVLVGAAASFGVGLLAKNMIDASSKVSNLRVAFETITGSTKAAGEELAYVSKVTNDLGINFESAAKGYTVIASAAMGTTLAGKQTRDVFLAVAQASKVLGLSADDTNGALLAIGQMISKGKVSAEELRGQLGERLPGAFQIAAKAMGMTTEELDKFMSAGNLLATDFIPKFAKAMTDRFGGSAAKAAQNFDSAIARIGNGLFTLQASLGGVIQNNKFFADGLNKISKLMDGLNKDVDTNKTKWMEWAKQGALGAIDFGISGVKAAGSISSAFSGLAGGAQRVIAEYYEMRAAFLQGAAAGAKWKDSLGLTTGEAQRLGNAAAEAATKANQLKASSAASFAEMAAGSPKVEAVAASLQKFRDEVAKVEAKEIIPTGKTAQQSAEVQQDIVKIGNKWVGVARDISNTPIKAQVEIDEKAYSASYEILKKETERQAEAASKANRVAAVEVTESWDTAAKNFSAAYSEAIADISRKLDSLKAKADRSASSGRGASGGYATGGLVRGWSPHSKADNISAWLTAKEFVQPVRSVGKYGLAFMESVRRGTFPVELAMAGIGNRIGSLLSGIPTGNRLAGGGIPAGAPMMVGSGRSDAMTINLSFGGGSSIPVSSTRDNARKLLREFTRMNARSSQ